ncbi:hypothetical protein SGM_4053 [Streptomyces griseoaurantiacus M045]|uniref:Uncharacterized protein n=1 Tax=Streptomyces griseoaurantiacus M045 TaxID=996637 RepID=F3NLN9_9ACTN|nr:hypothetical protein SGM_4053 [Streptomyces griseoaurantiacus M045]
MREREHHDTTPPAPRLPGASRLTRTSVPYPPYPSSSNDCTKPAAGGPPAGKGVSGGFGGGAPRSPRGMGSRGACSTAGASWLVTQFPAPLRVWAVRGRVRPRARRSLSRSPRASEGALALAPLTRHRGGVVARRGSGAPCPGARGTARPATARPTTHHPHPPAHPSTRALPRPARRAYGPDDMGGGWRTGRMA